MTDQASEGDSFHTEDIQYEGRCFEDYAINIVGLSIN